MIPREREARVAGAILIVLATVLVWNVFHYPWENGYDAVSAAHYSEALGTHHRLPLKTETDVWHNPPLWFAIAGGTYHAGEILRLPDAGVPVQLLLVGLIARELAPERRWLVPLAMGAAAATPVLVRAGVLFHPEPLAALLTTAGLYVFVRAVARGRTTLAMGATAGILLGLANLTRTWAFAALVAVVIGALAVWWRDRRPARAFTVALVVAASAIVVPWLAVKTATYGSPFAYSKPDPNQWRQHGRPAEFYFSLDLHALTHTPYQPAFRNHLLPTVFADWYGDYWRDYEMPLALRNEPEVLPARYGDPLVRQVWVGVVLSLFTIVGLVGLIRRAWRRRDIALATFLLSAAALVAMFVAFLVQNPKQDGDNMKALYLLNIAPVVALACGWGIGAVASRGRIWRIVTAVVLVEALALSTTFLVLSLG
jgi:4-amino-4-deoxy-L-arabinose transferase-like glycosyltransferase